MSQPYSNFFTNPTYEFVFTEKRTMTIFIAMDKAMLSSSYVA